MAVGRRGEPVKVLLENRVRVVTGVRDCWQVEDRWWTEEPVSRTYYELELEEGEIRTLFHDVLGGRWYEQRVR